MRVLNVDSLFFESVISFELILIIALGIWLRF